MKINQITVHAGRTFNHPHEQFASLKPGISLVATLDPDDDPIECAKSLQKQAEQLSEDHKRDILNAIDAVFKTAAVKDRVKSLSETVRDAQEELDELREKFPDAAKKP